MNRSPEMNRPPEDEFRDLVQELRRAAPEPPPIQWGAYRAELRDKLERRQAPAPWTWAWSWKSRPLQIAVATSLVKFLARLLVVPVIREHTGLAIQRIRPIGVGHA